MNRQGMETRQGGDGTAPSHSDDSPVPEGDAPEHPSIQDWKNRTHRAEAECRELREQLRRQAMDALIADSADQYEGMAVTELAGSSD